MKQKLESIVKKGRMIALAGLMSLTIGCASISDKAMFSSPRFYFKPNIGAISPISLMFPLPPLPYDPAITVGGAFGLLSGKFGLEAGLNYFNSPTKSNLLSVNLNFSLSKPTAKVKPYLIIGKNLLNESLTVGTYQFDRYGKVKNTTGSEFGFGTTISDRFDGRITYILMSGRERGMMTLTCGYRFSFGSKK
jgi:hypothetical protein